MRSVASCPWASGRRISGTGARRPGTVRPEESEREKQGGNGKWGDQAEEAKRRRGEARGGRPKKATRSREASQRERRVGRRKLGLVGIASTAAWQAGLHCDLLGATKHASFKVSCGRRFGECGAVLCIWSAQELDP